MHAPLFVPICIYLLLTLYLISSNIRYYSLFVGVRPGEANFPYSWRVLEGVGVVAEQLGTCWSVLEWSWSGMECYQLNGRLQEHIFLLKHTSACSFVLYAFVLAKARFFYHKSHVVT